MIAAELLSGTARYVEGQDEQNARTSGENAIVALPARTGGKTRANPIVVDYTASYGTSSYGMDPMVSQASVIHELAYGRINTVVPKTGGTGYPVSGSTNTNSLDIIV